MNEELHKKYRPTKLKEVIGQEDAVRMLNTFIKKGKIPHFLLFTGPSGVGKTTLARIMASKLDCGPSDFQELNCADFRGIDMVREIRSKMSLAALGGKHRVWYIDEAHRLTGDAQDAFLKLLEDTPKHVYFIFATTNPNKLAKTIITRASEIKLDAVHRDDIEELVRTVARRENRHVPDEVVERIADLADGSVRHALVLLGQVIDIENSEDQLTALSRADFKGIAIHIARALLNPKTKWPDMSKILKGVDEDPESIRRMVLGYASAVMRNNKAPGRCYLIITAFRDHWYDCGKAGLDAACWEVVTAK